MRPAALPALVLLAACAAACSAERAPAPEPAPTATVAAPRTLIAANFDPAALGARIQGMDVTEHVIGNGLAKVSAFVACPRNTATCDAATAPEGTVFTYVLTVTPQAEPEPSPTPTATDAAVVPVEGPAVLVRMTHPAFGFNAAAGFSRPEAAAALGAEDALSLTLDQNQLIWRVTDGTGWAAGKPITLWWQSTRAPTGLETAYRLEYAGKRAEFRAPFPAADKAVEPSPAR